MQKRQTRMKRDQTVSWTPRFGGWTRQWLLLGVLVGLEFLCPQVSWAQQADPGREPLGPKAAVFRSAMDNNLESALRRLDQFIKSGDTETERDLHQAFDRARIARLFYERGQLFHAKQLAEAALRQVARAERNASSGQMARARAITDYVSDQVLDGQNPNGAEHHALAEVGGDRNALGFKISSMTTRVATLPVSFWESGHGLLDAPDGDVQSDAGRQLVLRIQVPEHGRWIVEQSSNLIEWRTVVTSSPQREVNIYDDGCSFSFFRLRCLNDVAAPTGGE